MFGDERPTTTLDPEEVKRLVKETEKPKLANGSGGLAPIEDVDNWCEPTRTADPLLQRELVAATERESTQTPVVTPEAPVATAVTAVTTPVTIPTPRFRATTIVLLLILVSAAAGAIAARLLWLSHG